MKIWETFLKKRFEGDGDGGWDLVGGAGTYWD